MKNIGIILVATFILGLQNLKSQVKELDGPRFGATYITGETAEKLKDTFNAQPLISQFGWQFESEFFHLRSKGFSGLIETVILIGGVEQGKFFPSASGIIGFRTDSGLEFGFGPNLSLSGVALAFAIGATYTVEGINFPVNFAVVPSPDGARFSVLLGFNTSR